MNREFLSKLFDSLDGNIEIREIGQDKKAKRRFFTNVKDLNEYKIPLDKNVYFGIYSRLGKNGTAAGCLSTKTLWADYDNKTLDEVKDIISAKGLPEASVLVNSGHGIHAYWFLKDRVREKAEDLSKAICFRTAADIKAAEKARILRLPGSYNLKEDKPIKCEILESNLHEYDIKIFEEILSKELEFINKHKQKYVDEVTELKNCNRACIRLMAKGVGKGHRNFALCKITKLLQLRGYTRKAALEIIRKWNTLNNPPKEDKEILLEFNKTWDTDYKMLGCKFKENKALQEQCDYFCSQGECKFATVAIGEITSEGESKIDNLIFDDELYKNVSGLTLAIFFTIAKSNGITRDHLSEIIEINKKTKNFIKSIEFLEKNKFIKIMQSNKRLREKEILIIGNEYSHGRGYTTINNLLSETFLGKRITDTEYKLIALLKYYSFNSNSVYPTRETLAFKMGTTEKTITNTLKSLERKMYIKRSYFKLESGSKKLVVKLLL